MCVCVCTYISSQLNSLLPKVVTLSYINFELFECIWQLNEYGSLGKVIISEWTVMYLFFIGKKYFKYQSDGYI